MVFTYNGDVNDYFIGIFFYSTALLGKNYFKNTGMSIPEKAFFKDEKGDLPIECDKLDNENLERYFDRLMKNVNEDILKYIKDKNLYQL